MFTAAPEDRVGREDVDESFGPASAVLRGYGRRVGAGTWSDLLSGLTPHLGCLETDPSPGSRSFRHPPALPVRSAWPGQEAGVSQIGGQRVRAIPQPQRKRDGNDNRRRHTRHHRRRGHPRRHARRRRARSPRRAARRPGVPGHRGRVRRPAGLAWRVRGPRLVGVEGTGSYGAGLARYLAAARVRVVEVDRADRQDRHRAGKSDPLDAVSAAGPPSLAGQPGHRRAGTARWRRSGR